MVTRLDEEQWCEILCHPEITRESDIAALQALYSFQGHQAPGKKIAILLGYGGKAPQSRLNIEFARYAKRIAKSYDISFTRESLNKYRYWDLFFNGWGENGCFIWQIKPELVAAMETLNLTGEKSYPEEVTSKDDIVLEEGAKRTIIINAYERNTDARVKCIAHWGYSCSVCGFDFQKVYGEIGRNFIHVHHLIPLSEIGRSYQINPIQDLRPVCPNCHAMLHKATPPLSIEQLKEIIEQSRA